MFDIVLASHNGERFLKEQLDSIFLDKNLPYINCVIIIDDASSDNTLNIIHDFQKQTNRIQLHSLTGTPIGPASAFNYGLQKTNSDWIMLCDQDDIWHSEKILNTVKYIDKKRLKCQQNHLIFSDVLLVDSTGQQLNKTYSRFKEIPEHWYSRFENLLQQNVVSGCATTVSKALLRAALPIPDEAYMHDWWIVLFASAFGEIHKLDREYVYYRQHEKNTIGARKRLGLKAILNFFSEWTRFKNSVEKIIAQAAKFKTSTNYNNGLLEALINIPNENYYKRLLMVSNYKLRRSTKLASFIYLLVLMNL